MVHLDWEYVDLTALTELDSGNDITVQSKTWAEVISQGGDTEEQLYKDTGALDVTTAFHKLHVLVKDVYNPQAQNLPISGFFGLSTIITYAYFTTGNWAGICLEAKLSHGNQWRIFIRFRRGLLDEVGGFSSWYNENVEKWIKVTLEDVAGKPKITYKVYDDADFTEPPSFTGTFTSTLANLSPFRYAFVCASAAADAAAPAHDTYNYYTYQKVIPVGGQKSRLLSLLLRGV